MSQSIDYELAPISALEAEIGRRLAASRLAENLSQAQLAEEAGVARRTITRLENGEGVSLETLIRVMRALGLARRLESLSPDPKVRPIDRVRLKGKERKRARPKREQAAGSWTWADDRGDGGTE
jgi:transcriptional regulator with XRE-family HTH domain